MTTAVLGQGTDVTWGSHIDEVTSVTFSLTTPKVDVTSHDSAGRTREFIAGLIEGSEVPVAVNWVPASHDSFIPLVGDTTATDSLVITTEDGSGVYTVDAYVSAVDAAFPATGEAQTGTITFQTTGPWNGGS